MIDLLFAVYFGVSITLIVMMFLYYIVGAFAQFVRWLLDF